MGVAAVERILLQAVEHHEAGRPHQADALCGEVLKLHPDFDPGMTRARFNLAIALTGQARLAEAEDAYRSVIAGDCANRGVWLNLGNVLADQKKPDEAVVAYRRALEVKADEPGVLGNLGAALYRLGRFDEAIIHYRRATELASDNVAGCCCPMHAIGAGSATAPTAPGIRPCSCSGSTSPRHGRAS